MAVFTVPVIIAVSLVLVSTIITVVVIYTTGGIRGQENLLESNLSADGEIALEFITADDDIFTYDEAFRIIDQELKLLLEQIDFPVDDPNRETLFNWMITLDRLLGQRGISGTNFPTAPFYAPSIGENSIFLIIHLQFISTFFQQQANRTASINTQKLGTLSQETEPTVGQVFFDVNTDMNTLYTDFATATSTTLGTFPSPPTNYTVNTSPSTFAQHLTGIDNAMGAFDTTLVAVDNLRVTIASGITDLNTSIGLPLATPSFATGSSISSHLSDVDTALGTFASGVATASSEVGTAAIPGGGSIGTYLTSINTTLGVLPAAPTHYTPTLATSIAGHLEGIDATLVSTASLPTKNYLTATTRTSANTIGEHLGTVDDGTNLLNDQRIGALPGSVTYGTPSASVASHLSELSTYLGVFGTGAGSYGPLIQDVDVDARGRVPTLSNVDTTAVGGFDVYSTPDQTAGSNYHTFTVTTAGSYQVKMWGAGAGVGNPFSGGDPVAVLGLIGGPGGYTTRTLSLLVGDVVVVKVGRSGASYDYATLSQTNVPVGLQVTPVVNASTKVPVDPGAGGAPQLKAINEVPSNGDRADTIGEQKGPCGGGASMLWVVRGGVMYLLMVAGGGGAGSEQEEPTGAVSEIIYVRGGPGAGGNDVASPVVGVFALSGFLPVNALGGGNGTNLIQLPPESEVPFLSRPLEVGGIGDTCRLFNGIGNSEHGGGGGYGGGTVNYSQFPNLRFCAGGGGYAGTSGGADDDTAFGSVGSGSTTLSDGPGLTQGQTTTHLPPNTGDADYVSTVGQGAHFVGSALHRSGDGLVVIANAAGEVWKLGTLTEGVTTTQMIGVPSFGLTTDANTIDTDVGLDMGVDQPALLPRLASDPSTPVGGWMYYNTTTHTVKVYDENTVSWKTIPYAP